MKILMTGITGRMCGNERRAKKSPLYGRMQGILYADELDAMGHDVHHYLPEWGADLYEYDKIFVGIAPLSSLSANNFVEVGKILHDYGDRIILYVEDWSVENLTKDWTSKLADEGWRKHLKWKGYEDANQPALIEARKGLLQVVQFARCPWPVVCSMFPWGDHDVLMGPSYECVALDVSPLINYDHGYGCFPVCGLQPYVYTAKDRRWILGALSDQDRWVQKQNFSWPVQQFGHRSSGQTRLPEPELVDAYATAWGVLCPPYKKSGTGWWRNRYNWAAHVGSILLCDKRDGMEMGSGYTHDLDLIEGCDEEHLKFIANEQRDWFNSHIWTREQFRDAMSALLNRS